MSAAGLLGLVIGAAAGISPGPLLMVVIAAALRSGWRAGALTACSPLLSDAIVVVGVLLVLDHLPHQALAVLGLAGGVFVAYTGITTMRDARTARLTTAGPVAPVRRSLRQGVTVNLLSPHPWVMWATVLGPLTIAAWRAAPVNAVAFVGGFYLALVGLKVVLAVLVSGGRRWLTDRGYRIALACSGALLIMVGVTILVEFGRTLL